MATEASPWYSERRGLGVVTLYLVGALVGALVASGLLIPSFVTEGWDVAYYEAHPLVVPAQLYLFAYLGALVHVFVALLRRTDVDVETVVRLGLRVPTALLLVTGVYLAASILGLQPVPDSPASVRTLVGVAFFVGLFVEHALAALSIVSARLYPGDPSQLYDDGIRGG
ncbi:hypothetical protein [Halogeometricum limi]|uniref:Uncharacterized protein n=1 Tax=Halogeometricum limi TaxID=555875 RepID=A0A1I6ICZ2_9EURY|nr:hypothetical protein [Halogeometricum limi]SFR64602.1 hypothetical protein SAMN04488124_3066 [Halogeometricum limi]